MSLAPGEVTPVREAQRHLRARKDLPFSLDPDGPLRAGKPLDPDDAVRALGPNGVEH